MEFTLALEFTFSSQHIHEVVRKNLDLYYMK